ncbi:MAG TPA: hypothetical protein VLH79_13010 [Chthonomonadales bacterium]|nr:hypothetical protein [Chthonomonadales bacterium]
MREGHCIVVAGTALLLAVLATPLAAGREAGAPADVRRAAHAYYSALVLGDAEQYIRHVRFPLQAVRDGVVSARTEAQARALVRALTDRRAARPLSEEEKATVARRLREVIDEARIEFVGADTASVAFLIGSGNAPRDGDRVCLLLLHRGRDGWRVIAEVTDSKPVPPAYLREDIEPPAPAR